MRFKKSIISPDLAGFRDRRHPLVRKLDEMVNEISLQIAEKEMEGQTPKIPAR